MRKLMLLAALAAGGCRAAELPEVLPAGRYQTELAGEPLLLELRESDGTLRGTGNLGGRPAVFQELPERWVLGRLWTAGGAGTYVLLRYGHGAAGGRPAAVALDLEAGEEGGELPQAGPRTGRYAGPAGGLIDLIDAVQVGDLLVGEARGFGQRLVLFATLEGDRFNGRLEARDGSAFQVTGSFEGRGDLILDEPGASRVLRRRALP